MKRWWFIFCLIIIAFLFYISSTIASCFDPCTQSELGKKKCVVGWYTMGTIDEVRECKYDSLSNCYGYKMVKNCKGTGLSCSNSNNIFDCKCLVSQSCTSGQKKCLERNSLPISPPDPDEIQQCNNGGGWVTLQTCSMSQDCVDSASGPQCIDKQCNYCCPSSKTCSTIDYGIGCTSGTCCLSEYYCKSNTTPSGQGDLSNVQSVACQSADTNNNCNSLNQLNIVTKEQCCSHLNLCCSSNTIVSNTDFKSVLISALTDYFTHPSNAKLTTNEIKDLIVIYFSSSGNTIDLSGTGTYSGENLIDIYNKAKGTTSCTPNCIGKCGGASDNCGGTCNNPCSPISNYPKLDQPAPASGGTYYGKDDHYSAGQIKTYTLPITSLSTSQNINRIEVMIAGLINYGDVGIKLISPSGQIWTSDAGGFSDETIELRAQTSSYPNYPADYLEWGDYILEITAHIPSNIRIWWNFYV